VIVFDIKYNLNCLKNKNCLLQNSASLVFKTEIRSNLFPIMSLNDVVEASPTEFYVTQWLPYSYPKRGKKQPDTIREYVNVVLNNPYLHIFFNYKGTTVFHCTWDVNIKPICKIATKEKFLMANGVTISPDRNTVYLNDATDKNIMALSRNAKTGQLTKEFDIHLPCLADNIEYDDEANEIIIGSFLPEGMAVTSPTKDGDGHWVTKGVLIHDATKLKQISTAARFGNSKIVLGSAFFEGILICFNASG